MSNRASIKSKIFNSIFDKIGGNKNTLPKVSENHGGEFFQYDKQKIGLIEALQGLRIGNGLDFHEFSHEEGEFAIPLGGVAVKHKHKIVAHSDGDVILHALCEAIFGALASGNIGTHFPPSESKWKNASSTIFLEHALNLLHSVKGEIINIDCTVICEAPKVMPHAQKIRENLASIIKIPLERISIKATTTEKLGFLGKGEGLGCTATILVLLK